MCGISGWQRNSNKPAWSELEAKHLQSSLSHRGPDSKGSYLNHDKTLFLGHNRLSILDLSSAGHQPMTNEHGDILILNGEIYNYLELKNQLLKKGHTFVSTTDTEVLLRSYTEWGIDCLDKIKGMYAFALWSARDSILHLVRDPLGMKPLYFWSIPNGNGIAFASEVRAFFSLPGFNKSVDTTSLGQYLEFGYTFDSDKTIFSAVSKLPPGNRLEIRQGQVRKKIAFYSPILTVSESAATRPSEDSLLAEDSVLVEDSLLATLNLVVKEHLNADVPIAVLLSGGLDSSLIAAIAAQHTQIDTFSMGFADSQVDERPFARQVSEHIGSNHHELLIQPHEVIENLQTVTASFDDLFADWGLVSTRLLYKKCRELGIKVTIVGEGSDELFGGYQVFHRSLALQQKPQEWQIFQLYRYYSGRRYGRHYPAFRKIMKSLLAQSNHDLFSAVRLFESRHQLPNNYVMKVDKASMSQSIEARAPFLDSRIADLAYQIPASQLIASQDEKLILKSIARRHNLLPEGIINRRKYGAGIASNWMDDSGEFRNFAKDIILTKDSWVDELNLRDAMERYFINSQSGYAFPRPISIFRNLAWKLLILNLWSNSLNIPYPNE